MLKRYRKRSAKPGQLLVYFGISESGEPPDVCFAWGDGCSSRDAGFLHMCLGTERPRLDLSTPSNHTGPSIAFDKSLIEELKARGYDIATLKFSIEKRKEPS